MSRIKVDDIRSRQNNSHDGISLASDSSVALKHSGNQKLVTSSTGITITGACAATSFTGDGSTLSGIDSKVGGGSEKIFQETPQTVNSNFTTTAGKNYLAVLPLTINATLSVTAGSSMSFV